MGKLQLLVVFPFKYRILYRRDRPLWIVAKAVHLTLPFLDCMLLSQVWERLRRLPARARVVPGRQRARSGAAGPERDARRRARRAGGA